jgi:hypothetical protein
VYLMLTDRYNSDSCMIITWDLHDSGIWKWVLLQF